MKKNYKYDLCLFDDLAYLRDGSAGDGSWWQGALGRYFIKHSGEHSTKRPVAFLTLNRRFLSGLFATEKPNLYKGDILTGDKKEKILVKVKGRVEMKIYKKVPKESRPAS